MNVRSARRAARLTARHAANAEPERVRMLARDLLTEACAAPTSRPGRALLTALGTVLGVGLFVLTLGLTASTNAAVNADFNALVSTEVDASTTSNSTAITDPTTLHRVQRLRGVLAAGAFLRSPASVSVTHYPPRPEDALADTQISVQAGSPGALGVIAPTLVAGRSFDRAQESIDAHVALVGSAAAVILGMRHASLPWWVRIAGVPFLVDGVFADVKRHSDALLSVVIPYATAKAMPSIAQGASPEVIVATRVGYSEAVAGSLPSALDPREPSQVRAAGLPQPRLLRNQISSNLTALFALLAGVGMVVGMVGITNSAVVSVMERIHEIGVRRALGARKRQIAAQFLLENLAIGTVGGVLGVCLGLLALTGITIAKGWTPVLPLWVAPIAVVAGSLTGLLAGLYPAVRAANLDPVEALAR